MTTRSCREIPVVPTNDGPRMLYIWPVSRDHFRIAGHRPEQGEGMQLTMAEALRPFADPHHLGQVVLRHSMCGKYLRLEILGLPACNVRADDFHQAIEALREPLAA